MQPCVPFPLFVDLGKNRSKAHLSPVPRPHLCSHKRTITNNTPVDLIIPTLIIAKSVNPTEVDTQDIFTYTIEIEHTSTSNARAYDVLLKDVLPTNVSYLPGTLAGNANFIGTEADLFSGS